MVAHNTIKMDVNVIYDKLMQLGASPNHKPDDSAKKRLDEIVSEVSCFSEFREFYHTIDGCKQRFGDADWNIWNVGNFRV